MRVLATQAFFL